VTINLSTLIENTGIAKESCRVHWEILDAAGRSVQGTYNHQDHARVGAAVPDRLQALRVEVLKGMGCNAIRTSHNLPAPELIDACDQLGVLVFCETHIMSSGDEGLAQLPTMIRRFRNHPWVLITILRKSNLTARIIQSSS
jgi:beta-galactosidase